MTDADSRTLEVGTGSDRRVIAVCAEHGVAPGLFWLGGLKADMHGIKASALAAWAAESGRACVRFDYSGHGWSEGDFTAGTIGRWLEEGLAVFDVYCEGPQVVVGSSMGGWLAVLLARILKGRTEAGQAAKAWLKALVLIAPAIDFTEVLMWQQFSPAVKQTMIESGVWVRPSAYSEDGYPITMRLIEEGRQHLLLGGLVETGCPVRILQGVQDPDVPWSHAVELVSRLARDDVVLTLIKDGDHRLSRPEDIARLIRAVGEFCQD